MRVLAAFAFVVLLSGCSGGGDADGEGEDEQVVGEWPEPMSDIVAGQALPMEVNGHVMELGEGHQRLAVTLLMRTDAPGNVAMNVTSPEGRWDRVSTGPFLYVFPGTKPTVSFLDPEPGMWSALVEMTGTGAPHDYEVHFCADSAERPGPQANLACHREY